MYLSRDKTVFNRVFIDLFIVSDLTVCIYIYGIMLNRSGLSVTQQ